MNNTFQTQDLINYIGTQFNYKGYKLILTEINGNFARLTHPITGETARISKLEVKSLIENKRARVA